MIMRLGISDSNDVQSQVARVLTSNLPSVIQTPRTKVAYDGSSWLTTTTRRRLKAEWNYDYFLNKRSTVTLLPIIHQVSKWSSLPQASLASLSLSRSLWHLPVIWCRQFHIIFFFFAKYDSLFVLDFLVYSLLISKWYTIGKLAMSLSKWVKSRK